MAETEHKQIIDITVKGGEKTIKDLRTQIKSLKDEIANLALNGKDATEQQKKLQQANNEYADAIQQVNKALVDNISDADTANMTYNEMQREMTRLKKAFKDTADQAQRSDLAKRISELDTALKGMDAEIGQYQRNVGNYTEGVSKGTMSLREEIRNCRLELEKMDETSDEYAKKLIQLATAQRRFADIQEEAKFASTDFGDRLATITKLGSNLAAGFGAVQGAMALFGSESEAVGKTLVKLQAIMALVNGLNGMDGLIKNVKGLSKSFAPAIQAVKTFITGLTGMKAAIAATGIGALAVALGTVAANWDKISEAINKTDVHKETAQTSAKDFWDNIQQIIRDAEKTADKKGDLSEWNTVIKAIYGTIMPSAEDIKLLSTQLYNKGIYESLKEQMAQASSDRGKLMTEIKALGKQFGVDDKYLEQFYAGDKRLEFLRNELTKKASQTGADITNIDKIIEDVKNFRKLSKDLGKIQDDITAFWNSIKDQEAATGKELIFPLDEEQLRTRIEVIKSFYTEEQKLTSEHRQRMKALEGTPELQAKEEEEFQKKLKEIRDKANADEIAAAKATAETRKQITERLIQDTIITEIETRKTQYLNDISLFSNNVEMKRKLTEEYYRDLSVIDKQWTEKILEEDKARYTQAFNDAIAVRMEQYEMAATMGTGPTPTQENVEAPTGTTEDEVLGYQMQLAAAQAFYEAEIEWQNDVIRNQITILESMRETAREMGNTDAAITFTEQINTLNDQIVANDNAVANQRVANQQKIAKATEAANKQQQTTGWNLEAVMNMGQSIGRIFASTANMMDKESEEGLATYKALATASATIDTIASATAAFRSLASIPIVGPALGAAAAAAAIASGIANIAQIQKTQLGGSSSISDSYGSSTSSVANVPDIDAWEPQYTRNVQTDTETSEINKPIYVTVTDIKKGLDRETKVTDNAKF